MSYVLGILQDEDFDIARLWRQMSSPKRSEIQSRMSAYIPEAMYDFLDRDNEIWQHPATWTKFQEATMNLICLIPVISLELDRCAKLEQKARAPSPARTRERKLEAPLLKSLLVSRAQTHALRCRPGCSLQGGSKDSMEEDPFADP